MSNIYDFPFPARLLRKYVSFAFKRFYGEYIVVGRENIPAKFPIIFAPNHIDALMDALAVHSIAPKGLPIVFLARSDIFKNKSIGKILRYINMMPAFRMRDGMENLGKNNEIFERCVEVLHHNKALGIMPEGNQGDKRKLRPFTKGIFRIAFTAQQKYGTLPAVKIIPVGIDIGDFVKFGKHIIINIGKPIEVSEYMTLLKDNQAVATNEIRDRLKIDLSNLTIDLASETHYQCFETAVEVSNTSFVKKLELPNKTVYRFVARQNIAKSLLELEKEEPEKMAELDLICKEYREILYQLNLKTWTLEQSPYNKASLLLDGLLLLGTFPGFIQGFILNILPFQTPVLLRKILKIEYPGFFRSVHFGFGILTFPLFYVLQTILFHSLFDVQWWLALLFFISQYVFGKWAFQWYREARRYIAKVRYWKFERNNNSYILIHAQTLRKKIIQLIIK